MARSFSIWSNDVEYATSNSNGSDICGLRRMLWIIYAQVPNQ